jgi:hypothetical protein
MIIFLYVVIQKDQVEGIGSFLSPSLNPSRQGREAYLGFVDNQISVFYEKIFPPQRHKNLKKRILTRAFALCLGAFVAICSCFSRLGRLNPKSLAQTDSTELFFLQTCDISHGL